MRLRTAEQQQRIRERERKRRLEARTEALKDRTCAWCGAAVPLSRNAQSTVCSDECSRKRAAQKSRDYYVRHGGARRGTRESREKLSAATKTKWETGQFRFKPQVCRGCETEFAPSSGSQRYCSAECRWFNRTAAEYGMSGAEYRAMLEAQGGLCALCGGGKKGWSKSGLVVDHCHHSGKIRGLLCGDCNTALGRFNDDPALLRRALEYLERT